MISNWWDLQGETDVLQTLAQLPNDEVLTTPSIARTMLSSLPEEVWLNPELRWFDPASKSGVFLREIYRRLMSSLADWELDPKLRRQHILKNMVFACAVTELTAQVTRRTLYQSRDASGKGLKDPEALELSVKFDNPDGNVVYKRDDHIFTKSSSVCNLCGANQIVTKDSRENFAYPFIHSAFPREDNELKFDVIVGNPPYQIGMKDESGERTANITPLYNRFVQKAIAMNPKYVLMITPSRWFTGGKHLTDFRDAMLQDRRIRKIVDYPNGKEIFPGVIVKGGISYFLWDRDFSGDCEYTQVSQGKEIGRVNRDLREGDGVLVRDIEAIPIVSKVTKHKKFGQSLDGLVSTRDPFGAHLTSNFANAKREAFPDSIPLIFNNKVGHISVEQIGRNQDWIMLHKVLIPKASDGRSAREGLTVLGEPIVLGPGSVCTQSYLVAGTFKSSKQAKNFSKYLVTKFVRFLVLQRKVSQDLIPSRFRFVPWLDFDKTWSDEDLYAMFGLTSKEIAYIERTVSPRTFIDSARSAIPETHLPGGRKFGVLEEEASEDSDDD